MRESKSSIISKGDVSRAYNRVKTDRAFYMRTPEGSRAEKTAEGLLNRSKNNYNKKANAYRNQGGNLNNVNKGNRWKY